MGWWSFKPYVSVAQRRAKADSHVKKLQKSGRTILPVHLEGRTIARTFWGKAWCDNLESYSDYSNRLPRGRTYVRNGSVCDLQVEPGRVTALVCGSDLYRIKIDIKPLPAASWTAVKRHCAGQIGSLIELLQGRLSQGVMQIITRRDGGLFPTPQEIDLNCSCPDWADMCKHVAAALYGVGARLDERPEMLFVLRQVDHLELISQAGDVRALTGRGSATKTIADGDLSDVFGIELQNTVPAAPPADAQPAARTRKAPRNAPPAAPASQTPLSPRQNPPSTAKNKSARPAPRTPPAVSLTPSGRTRRTSRAVQKAGKARHSRKRSNPAPPAPKAQVQH